MSTAEFDLNAIPGVQEWFANAGQQVYDQIQEGAAGKFKLSLTVTINSEDLAVTAKCKTSLPQPDTITLPTIYAIRQNGALQIENPKQAKIGFEGTDGQA